MSGLFWASSTTKFDEDIDRATAETLPTGEEDLELNFEISDSIRSKSVPPKDAMRSIKRRINHKNPNVQLLALGLTDTCVKNGGDHFLVEIASREFMDNLVSLLKTPVLNTEVKQRLLRVIQNWAVSFESKPIGKYTNEVYKTLQKEGYSFPPIDPATTSAAMSDTLAPPEWIDSDLCMRCRTPFSFTNRKHHCRCCGLIFDQQCSSKSMALPHLGIMQPVRVCDGCYVKVNKAKAISLSEPSRGSRRLSQADSMKANFSQEPVDEDLQRAIQLSLEEAGLADPGHGPRRVGYVPPTFLAENEPPLVDPIAHGDLDDDPDLRAAIEASLREAQAPKASAPVEDEPTPYNGAYVPSPPTTVELLPNFDLEPTESDAILTFSQTVDSAQGTTNLIRQRELYDRANNMRPKLTRSLDDTGRREQMLSEMNEKLSEAARLYDRLLTSQISTSRYSTPQRPEIYSQHSASAYHAPSVLYQSSAPSSRTNPVSHQSYASQPEPQVHYYEQPTQAQSAAPIQQPEASQAMTQAPAPPLTSQAYQQQHEAHNPTPSSFTPSNLVAIPPLQSPEPQAIHQPLPPTSVPPLNSHTNKSYSAVAQDAQSHVISSPPQHYQSINTMPVFPSVPTAPLPNPTYRASEPKEAMLISFD